MSTLESRWQLASVLIAGVMHIGCAGPGDNTPRIVRPEIGDSEKRHVAREVRYVLPEDHPYELDLTEYSRCELHLAAAPGEHALDIFRAELLAADSSVVREIELQLPQRPTAGRDDENEIPDLAETAVDPDREDGWVDEIIALDDLGVKKLRLPVPPAGGVWARPLLSCPGTSDDRRFNVILISLDTLRADRLGVYGGRKYLTPVLDRYAHRSVVFENAFTTFPNTLGAHASLFTGFYPSQHGLAGSSQASLPTGARTLAAHFAEHGYATVAFTENAFVSSDLGFHVGFDRYHNGPEGKGNELFPGVARQTFARGLEWLGNKTEAPFFLFLHTYEVHTPYTPTWHARQLRLQAEGIDYEGEFEAWFGGLGEIVFNRRERIFTDAELRQIERLYDAEVTILDRLTGDFLAGLQHLGLHRDTIVVLFSDHGEEFNEHGFLGHGETLHDQAIRIPLILHAPVSVARSRRITEVVSILDVASTVADLAGLPPFAADAPGRNLAGWIRGSSPPTGAPAVSELDTTDASCRDRTQGELSHCEYEGLSIRDGEYSYLRSTVFGWERLFDARTDADERVDIADANPDLLARYRAQADEHEAYVRETRAPTGRATLLPATSRKLKALGYID